MARATQVLTSLEHPEGDWKVDEMMEATEEAEEEAERLETDRCAASSAAVHALASPAKLQSWATGMPRRQAGANKRHGGQETATAGKLPKL